MSKRNGLACPECHSMNNGTMDVEGSQATPEDGDLSICVYCGTVSIFVITGKDSYMRPLTPREEKTILTDQRVKMAQEIVLKASLPRLP